MSPRITQLSLLLVFGCSALVPTASAQSRNCNLRVLVYETKLDGRPGDMAREIIMDETTWIPDATAVLYRSGSKTVVRGLTSFHMPFFPKLVEGQHTFVVSKPGYRSAKHFYSLDCDCADNNGLVWAEFTAAARAVRVSGEVEVRVLIDAEGNVISANAVSGHPLLRPAATAAARGAKFSPTLVDGVPVKVSGVIAYNFVP